MTQQHRIAKIREASNEGEGFCLHCGVRQPVVETNPFLRGPCIECFHADVLPAGDVLRALNLVNEDPEFGESSLIPI